MNWPSVGLNRAAHLALFSYLAMLTICFQDMNKPSNFGKGSLYGCISVKKNVFLYIISGCLMSVIGRSYTYCLLQNEYFVIMSKLSKYTK